MSKKPQKTNFQLQSFYADGSSGEPQLHKIEDLDTSWRMGRREFLVTSAVGLALLNGLRSQVWAADGDAPALFTGGCQDWVQAHTGSVHSAVFSPDGKLLASGSGDDTIKLWELPSGELLTCLFDPATPAKDKKAAQYTTANAYGQTITYTLPCGSPIPPGAVCVCMQLRAGDVCAAVFVRFLRRFRRILHVQPGLHLQQDLHLRADQVRGGM